MSSDITKGLAEAYNSIYSQEISLYEEVGNFIDYLDEIGYDVSVLDEDNIVELFIICNSDIDVLNEGVEKGLMSFGKLASALEKAKEGASALNLSKQLASAQKYEKPVQQAAQQVQQTAQRAPGLLQNLATGWKEASAARQAEKAARRLQPNPLVQQIQQRAGQKLSNLASGAVKVGGWGSLAAGVGGAVDQGLLGGVVGKATRDFTNWTRKAGSSYDAMMGRNQQPAAPASPPAEKPISLPAGYKLVNGKVVREEFIITKHLLDEGYATTEQQASIIAANMGENWKQSILGDVK